MRTLFTVDAKYTMDTCAFNEIFDEERHFNKRNVPGVWDGISEMILKGEIISHKEVYKEIMKGPYDELKFWARNNASVFSDYDFKNEGDFIAEIGKKGFKEFVHQGKKDFNADPWLVAQANIMKLTIITQEKGKGLLDIPTVCEIFKTPYLDIFGLIKNKGWTLYKR